MEESRLLGTVSVVARRRAGRGRAVVGREEAVGRRVGDRVRGLLPVLGPFPAVWDRLVRFAGLRRARILRTLLFAGQALLFGGC